MAPAVHETALARLVPMDRAAFAVQAWGRTPLLVTREERGEDDFADLFGLGAVDELLTHRGLRTPFLRMARDGATLPDSDFTGGGGIGAGVADQVHDDRVRELFAEGATIVLQGLHRTWEPVTLFSQDLAADLGHPVQVNAYITPPQNQGFSDHYDIHDVFVLQVHGTKRWILHAPVLDHPLRNQPWNTRADQVARAADSSPYLDVELRPGDCLYLPRGWIHAARALGGISAHLTVGVHTWTGDHVATALSDGALSLARQDPTLRANLGLGVDVSDAQSLQANVERVRAAMIQALRTVDGATIAEALHARHRSAQRPAAMAPLAQLAAAEQVGPSSSVRLRDHLLLTMEPLDPADAGTAAQGPSFRIRSRAGRGCVDAQQARVLTALRAEGPLTIEELGDVLASHAQPGREDATAAALEAVRMLMGQGLVEEERS